MSRIRPVLSCVVALALCIPVAARAWENDGDDTWDHSWDDPDRFCADDGPADSAVVQQKLATKFGVEESQIASLRGENLGYGEIDHTLTLAERLPGGITTENVDTVLAMRQDQHMGWGQIAKAEGTTLGNAKREFPTQPPVEPKPVDESAATSPQTTQPSATAQPKSLVRSGKSATARGSSASASAHGGKGGGKGSVSRGSSNRPATTMTASSTSAPAGHAYGRGGSSSVGSSAKANGKAKGHK